LSEEPIRTVLIAAETKLHVCQIVTKDQTGGAVPMAVSRNAINLQSDRNENEENGSVKLAHDICACVADLIYYLSAI
jgi:hypothetical protein